MADKNTHARELRYHDTDDGFVRLLVVDRQPSVRRGLKMRLALEDVLEGVGEAGGATEAAPWHEPCAPTLILLNVEMPGGIATAKALRPAPHGAVVDLTLRDDSAIRERTREAGTASSVARHRTEGIPLAAIRGADRRGARRGALPGTAHRREGRSAGPKPGVGDRSISRQTSRWIDANGYRSAG